MPITQAYLLPHPPLAVPGVGRGDEGKTTDEQLGAICNPI